MFEQIQIQKEIFGEGENLLRCGSAMALPKEIRALYGKAQCVYLDPPFMTGEKYMRRRPYGEKGWRTGTPSCRYPAYNDQFTEEKEYLRLLRRLVGAAKNLLSETGVFYLHLDWRMSAQARIMCDKVFGKDRFLNEIIWGYESGGRSKRHFSRKHDVILLYAKSQKYLFDLTKVPLPRGEVRRNHMARGMDETGRAYSYITSNGKEYRYYDWTGLSGRRLDRHRISSAAGPGTDRIRDAETAETAGAAAAAGDPARGSGGRPLLRQRDGAGSGAEDRVPVCGNGRESGSNRDYAGPAEAGEPDGDLSLRKREGGAAGGGGSGKRPLPDERAGGGERRVPGEGHAGGQPGILGHRKD